MDTLHSITQIPFSSGFVLSFQDWISIITLGVVVVYTTVTFLLFRQQRQHQILNSRPWLSPQDIELYMNDGRPRLEIQVYNFGKQPAMSLVMIPKCIVIVNRDLQMDLSQATSIREVPVYPYMQGIESSTRHGSLFTPDQILIFQECRKITLEIVIKYRASTSRSLEYPYTFAATMEVGSVNHARIKQETMIFDVKAS